MRTSGQFFRKYIASSQDFISEQYFRPSHLNCWFGESELESESSRGLAWMNLSVGACLSADEKYLSAAIALKPNAAARTSFRIKGSHKSRTEI
jgi:hypothetical protein